MWTGVAGIVLGLVFLAPGLVLYLKNKKGEEGALLRVSPGHDSEGLNFLCSRA